MSANSEKQTYKQTLEFVKKEQIEQAIENYQKLIDKTNNKKKYLIELAKLYQKSNKNDKILECYLHIISFEPNDIYILNEIGMVYFNTGNYKEAISYFYKILKSHELPDVYNNIGSCFVNINNYTLGEANYIKSYNINQNENAKRALGGIYYYTKQYDKSLTFYKQIINKSYADLYNISFPYLAKQKFKKGFELYEYRLKNNNIERQTGLIERVDIPQIPYWNGTDICNCLLIVYEQGIGDNIQYFRFIIQLSKENPHMKICYFCKDVISHIFDISNYTNISIINNVVFSNYDYKIYTMSLPYILKLTTISPNVEQYIKIDDNKLLHWKEKLQHLKKFKVGFVYNGLLKSFIDKYIPIQEFIQLCSLDIDLICIHQKKDIDVEFPQVDNMHVFDIDTNMPFEDTIHILHNIDLLITIDTYIAHLAGVMNINTWLLLGNSEWRWSNNDTQTYWYNSVKLIRKKNEDKHFKDLIIRVKEMLVEFIC